MNELILTGLGTAASVGGFILAVNKDKDILVRALFASIFVLCGYASYLLYENQRYQSVEYQDARELFYSGMSVNAAEREAQELRSTFPVEASLFRPGDNEGIIYAGLAFLEKHRSIFPESYKTISVNVLADIDISKESRSSGYDEILRRGANATIRIIDSVAGREN